MSDQIGATTDTLWQALQTATPTQRQEALRAITRAFDEGTDAAWLELGEVLEDLTEAEEALFTRDADGHPCLTFVWVRTLPDRPSVS